MKEQLFVLGPSSQRDAARAVLDDGRPAWELAHCEVYKTVRKRRVGPLVVAESPVDDDVVWSWYSDLLFRDKAKRLVESELSGCGFRPVVFSDELSASARPMWELNVNGFAGFASFDRGLTLRNKCDDCGIYSYSFGGVFADFVDLAKWDGTDVFTIWPFPRIQICTKKAAVVMRRLSGLAVVPIQEFEVPGNSAAPGLPEAWLDEKAIRDLSRDPAYIRAMRS